MASPGEEEGERTQERNGNDLDVHYSKSCEDSFRSSDILSRPRLVGAVPGPGWLDRGVRSAPRSDVCVGEVFTGGRALPSRLLNLVPSVVAYSLSDWWFVQCNDGILGRCWQRRCV